jgi:hypothetical protein
MSEKDITGVASDEDTSSETKSITEGEGPAATADQHTELLKFLIKSQEASSTQTTALLAQFSQLQVTISSQASEIKSLSEELKTLKASEDSTEPLDERDADAEIFLDCRDYFDDIEAGFSTYPPRSETIRPHLFELHTDRTYSLLVSTKRKAALEEYKVTACILLYLSCAILAFKREIHEALDEESQGHTGPILATFGECETWMRKRLAFIRAQAQNEEHDPEFIEFARTEIYSQAEATQFGSSEFAALHMRYTQAKGRATLAASAKASASKGIKGQGTTHRELGKGKGKGKEIDSKGKGKLSALGKKNWQKESSEDAK